MCDIEKFCFEIRSHYLAQAGLEIPILLLQPPSSWADRCAPLGPVRFIRMTDHTEGHFQLLDPRSPSHPHLQVHSPARQQQQCCQARLVLAGWYLQRELLGELRHVGSPSLLPVQRHNHEEFEELPLLALQKLTGWIARGLPQAGLHVDQALAVGWGQREVEGTSSWTLLPVRRTTEPSSSIEGPRVCPH